MPQRRTLLAALGVVALVGFLVGGAIGLLGGGDDGGPPAAVAAPTASGPSPGASSPAATPPLSASIPAPTSPKPSAPPTRTVAPSTSKPPALTPGKPYMLILGDGRAMDVMGASDKDGAAVIVYPAGSTKANQKWVVRDAGNGMVRLQSVSSKKCLQVGGGKTAHAVQNDCGKSGDRQLWRPTPSGSAGVWKLIGKDGRALGMGGKVKDQQGLSLVAAGSATAWRVMPG